VSVERGFALIALLSLAALISAFLIASALNLTSAGISNEREQRSMNALRQAKAALIAYAASEQWQSYKGQATNQPGALPCPDILMDDGTADCVGLGILSNSSLIGRLPWQSIGTEDLRDASGERLWYALSYNFRKDFGTTVINSDTPGQLNVTGTAPASNVVAVLFAPGEAILGQNRPSNPADSAHNSPSNYLESFNLSDPVNYVFTTNALPSSTFNDRVLVITQAELMAAVEPVVAARIERDVKPLLQSYFGIWGFYPFAVPFAAGPPAAQPNYKGVAGQANGLMPVTDAPFTWLNSGSDLITVDLIGGGTGSQNITSWTCNGGVDLVCVVNYCCDDDDRPAIQLQATLSGPTTSFADGPPSSLVGTLSMIDGNGNPITGSSPAPWSGSTNPTFFPPTMTIAVQPKGLLVRFQGRLRNAQDMNRQATITVPSITRYLPNPAGAWFVSNQWYRQTYYAVSLGYLQGGGGSCSALPAIPPPPSCLTVNNLPPSFTQWKDKRAILVFAGRALNGSSRPSGTLANYLEGANLTAANGTTPFVYEHRAGVPTAINDRVVVVSP